MKIWQVEIEYTDTLRVANIPARTAEDAAEAAMTLFGSNLREPEVTTVTEQKKELVN